VSVEAVQGRCTVKYKENIKDFNKFNNQDHCFYYEQAYDSKNESFDTPEGSAVTPRTVKTFKITGKVHRMFNDSLQ
jgi:hypothetical protein